MKSLQYKLECPSPLLMIEAYWSNCSYFNGKEMKNLLIYQDDTQKCAERHSPAASGTWKEEKEVTSQPRPHQRSHIDFWQLRV